MIQVEHTRKQKIISLIAFLWMTIMAAIVVIGSLQNGSSVFSKLGTIFCASLVFLLFAYPCWFTFTYKFRANATKIVRKTGFTQTEIKWDDVTAWSIKTGSKQNTFDKEPILKNAAGQEMSLDAGVWYSSSNIAQAREQFLALVQAKLSDKCENSC